MNQQRINETIEWANELIKKASILPRKQSNAFTRVCKSMEFIKNMEFLIQQAERAKKYEHDLLNMNMQLKGAQRLNTRYREALEEIASKRMTYADMFGAIRTAKEALKDKERTNETIKFIRKH